MSTLVVYDSRFGNTEKIARAIGETLGATDVVRVSNVKPEQLTGVDLLIVGSPTHGFRPTPATTDLLKAIPDNALQGVKVAAFDTRIDPSEVKGFGGLILRPLMSIFGYAAKPIANRLAAKGGELIAPPEGFIVLDREGPLRDGELERAAHWARRLQSTQ
ncbi:MAG: flavodoxin family protein [Anaerolineae bacterium]|nr:flavodoxin family protein [Anaerolineae bacterium]